MCKGVKIVSLGREYRRNFLVRLGLFYGEWFWDWVIERVNISTDLEIWVLFKVRFISGSEEMSKILNFNKI